MTEQKGEDVTRGQERGEGGNGSNERTGRKSKRVNRCKRAMTTAYMTRANLLEERED